MIKEQKEIEKQFEEYKKYYENYVININKYKEKKK